MDGRRRVVAGAAALTLMAMGGAGTAHAAQPAMHCQASTATIEGIGITPPVSPITAGGDGPCADAGPAGTPVLPANPLIAADLLATTRYDAAAKTGTATGGLASLRVLPAPDLLAQVPQIDQAIDALAPVDGVLTLATGLPLIGAVLPVKVDVRDAVRSLLTPPGALLEAGLVTATATVSCAGNAPVLSGSSNLAAVKVLGNELPVDGSLTQAITVFGGQSIPLTSLDPDLLKDNVTVLNPLTQLPLAGPLLTQVLDALASGAATLSGAVPAGRVPPLVLDVSVTPGTQTRVGDTLTQRALRAKIDLSGVHVLDATIGEARVSADAGVCAPPPTVVEPPAPPEQGGVDAVTATGSVADQILACSDRKLVLMDVLRQGKAVKLLGAANRDYAGRQVAIRLKATKKVVGHATVQKDGSFQTTAPLPPATYRTKAKADLVRYTAEIGKEHSLPLKLDRRMIVSSLTSKDGKVTISGRVVGPLTKPATTIRLLRRVSCRQQALVTTFKPGRDGRFSVTVDAPAGQVAAVYRMTTSVRANAKNPKRFPTFTLPRGVALDQR